MGYEKHMKKIQIIITEKLGIESDIEFDRCYRIRSCKLRQTKIGAVHALLFAELTDLIIK